MVHEYYNEEDNTYFNHDDDDDELNQDSSDQEDKSDDEGSEDFREYSGIDGSSGANPKSIRERIDETLELLGNLKNRSEPRLSRVDLITTLSKDLSEYYGYLPELSEFLLNIFSPAECVEYMDASDRPRPLVIRTNTLKTTRKTLMEALGKRGAVVETIDWSKVAIKVTESSIPIGATPEYLSGHYMLQSAASMNPVLALAPQPNERVLDMSAAPGGKTSYIAQMMKNSGLIIANDLKPQRQKATVANLHRLGVKNSVVCCYDGRTIPKIMKGFDRVLLDAPCSGLGVISRDQSVKIQRTLKDVQRIAHLQKELLCAAVDAVDMKSSTGGIVVYSTCSISVEENEQVVQYILNKRFVRLIDTGLTVGKPGFTRYQERRFHASLSLTRRFYPHVHNMDGFFVAKFQKYGNGPREAQDDEVSVDDEDLSHEGDIEVEDFDAGEDLGGQELKKKSKKERKDKVKSKDIQPAIDSILSKRKGQDIVIDNGNDAVQLESKKSKKRNNKALTDISEESVEEPSDETLLLRSLQVLKEYSFDDSDDIPVKKSTTKRKSIKALRKLMKQVK